MTALLIENPAYFDRLADVERRHWWGRAMWRIAAGWLTPALMGRRALRALDLGCGTGETARRLAGLPGVARVMGIDPSPEALEHARRRHDFPLLRGSAVAVPLADATVDLLTCFDVLQHLPPGGDRVAAAEIVRVLRPGGLALIRSNGRGWSSDRTAYRLDGLVGVCRGAGLEVRRASYVNCLPAVAQEVRGRIGPGFLGGKVRAHPGGGGLRIAVPPPWLNGLMAGVSTAEALASARLGINLPFGHSTLLLAERPGSLGG